MPKPDPATAMRRLIGAVRETIPFDLPAARICTGSCTGCSLKLLEFLEGELCAWEARLDAGERVGLLELSQLAGTARKVHAVLVRNGVVADGSEGPNRAAAGD